jgi:hypothetical protein
MPGSGLGSQSCAKPRRRTAAGSRHPTRPEFASVREQNDGRALRLSADEPAGGAFEDGVNMDAATWKLRDARNRERFALGRAIAQMAAGERQLACAIDAFERRLDLVEHDLDVELRCTHWGRDPERLPAWRSGMTVTETAAPGMGIPDPTLRDGRVRTRVGVNDELAAVAVT